MFDTLYAPHQHVYTLRTGWVLEQWLIRTAGTASNNAGFRMRNIPAMTRIPFENTMADYFDVFMPKPLFKSSLARTFHTHTVPPQRLLGDWTSV